MANVRVLNIRPTFLTTPKIGHSRDREKHFPAKRLVPGGNNLTQEHVDALAALDPTQGPGKVWAMWLEMDYVRVMEGKANAKAIQEPEGPKAPKTLADRPPAAAEAMVAVEADPKVLRQWYGPERRDDVRQLIVARLEALGASLEN